MNDYNVATIRKEEKLTYLRIFTKLFLKSSESVGYFQRKASTMIYLSGSSSRRPAHHWMVMNFIILN